MANRVFCGPFDLKKEIVREKVPQKKGNYLFLSSSRVVKYVGRSDSDLQTEILQQMDTYRADGCTQFKYSLADSVKDAYETECRDYHNHGEKEKLNNRYHPDEPAGHHYPCPVEGCNHPE